MDKRFIAIFLTILMVGILFRSLTISYGTFMEPDVYMYYSVIQQTITNHMQITSQLSGFPVHNAYSEKPGLIYLTIAFNYLTGNTFLSMLILPVLFGTLEMLIVYLTTLEITTGKKAALFSMLIFAILPAAMWKNTMGEYRGESFVPLFAAVMVYAIIKGAKSENKAKLVCFPLVVLMAAASLWMWNGGIYASAILPFIVLFFISAWLMKGHEHKAFLVASAASLIVMALGISFIPAPYAAITESQSPTIGNFILGLGASFPLAILGLAQLLKSRKFIEAYAITPFFLVTFALSLAWIRLNILVTVPVAILAGVMLKEIWHEFATEKLKTAMWIVGMILFLQMFTMLSQIPFFAPVDGIGDPQLMQALAWARNNTAANATFLTAWPDGSLIEGIANRQSYSDSIMGIGKGPGFEKFLFQPEGNLTYLQIVKPDYLFVRKYWQYEEQSMALEAGLDANTSINMTNYATLENGTISFPIAFQNNETVIYKVN